MTLAGDTQVPAIAGPPPRGGRPGSATPSLPIIGNMAMPPPRIRRFDSRSGIPGLPELASTRGGRRQSAVPRPVAARRAYRTGASPPFATTMKI